MSDNRADDIWLLSRVVPAVAETRVNGTAPSLGVDPRGS